MQEAIYIPKIIENLRETLLQEAQRQLLEYGYDALTIRSVSKCCHVAVGTLYNYFPSKDVLVANILLADWQQVLCDMRTAIACVPEFHSGLRTIYEKLRMFNDRYRTVFAQAVSPVPAKYHYPDRHKLLRSQLEQLLHTLTCRFDCATDEFLLTFLAENLLTSSTENIPYAKLEPIFQKII